MFKSNEDMKRRIEYLEKENGELRSSQTMHGTANDTISPRVQSSVNGITKKRFYEMAAELEELQEFISMILDENAVHRQNGKVIYNHYITSLREKEKITVKSELDQQHLEMRSKLVC